MARTVIVRIRVPDELANLRFPSALQHRLSDLLDKQDAGKDLSAKEMKEVEGLVEIANLLSLLQLRMNGGT